MGQKSKLDFHAELAVEHRRIAQSTYHQGARQDHLTLADLHFKAAVEEVVALFVDDRPSPDGAAQDSEASAGWRLGNAGLTLKVIHRNVPAEPLPSDLVALLRKIE